MSNDDDDLTVVYLWAKKEAADEIEKLRAENKRLRAALEEIAFIDGPQSRGIPRRTSMGMLARKALREEQPFEDRWDNA